jgi:hypothetical protein
MKTWFCLNCCVEYPQSEMPPDGCTICNDERVITPLKQEWLGVDEIARSHETEILSLEPGLTSLRVAPALGIGQQSILVEQPDGCILWDCTPLVDDKVVRYIESRGGLKAIALSHPHFYGAMSTWSQAFGNVPVLIHENDRAWVVNPSSSTRFWSGSAYELDGGVTLLLCGRHFEGSCVLHVPQAANGGGALLTGDTIMVLPNALGVAVMRSYPLYVPLPPSEVDLIGRRLSPYRFDRIYGAWVDRVIENGNAELTRAVQHYKAALVA